MLQHLPFIARNALRNRRRSLLTIASVAVSLCLLGLLTTLYVSLFYGTETSPAQALRLVVHHRVSLAQSLPGSHLGRVRQVPGVVAVTPWQWFGGTYRDARDPANFFARFGVDPDALFRVRPEMVMPADQRRAFERSQTGAIASRMLAAKMRWKPGERITLVGDIFPVTLELTLAGVYDAAGDDEVLFFKDRYLQESLAATSARRDTVGALLVLADDPGNVPRIARGVDASFDNSPAPTKTESEKDFALSFLAFLGNLKLFLAAVSAAVTFAILLVSANTVAMAVRERVRETAILRTLGFAPAEILGFIVGEAGVLAFVGGACGALMAASLCYVLHNGAVPGVHFPLLSPAVAAGVVGGAVTIGLGSAAVPAWLASRQPVVASLRNAG